MPVRPVLASLVLSVVTGCTCAPEPAPAPPPPAPTAAAPREKPASRLPVVRRSRFDLPLTAEAAADPAKLRALVLELAGPQPDDLNAGLPKTGPRGRTRRALADVEAWKCREAHVWPAPDGAVVQWQRFAEGPCGGTPEQWWLERLRIGADRPADRIDEGRLAWSGVDEVRAWTGEAFVTRYETSTLLEQPAFRGAFPHDAAWIGEAVGAPIDGAPAAARSERWALARAVVAQEKVTFLLDRWTCADGRVLGATLSFETMRRLERRQGDLSDAVPSPRTIAFAERLATGLGASVGGVVPSAVEALRCAP